MTSESLIHLSDWEEYFSTELKKISKNKLSKAGGLLPLVPTAHDWETLKFIIRKEWKKLNSGIDLPPAVLILTYASVAFFEYGDHGFWNAFGEAVDDKQLVEPGRQSRLNTAYLEACKKMGLGIGKGVANTAYVGTAIKHVGVPLSFWEDFLRVCNWAIKIPNWLSFDTEQWQHVAKNLVGSKKRLLNFLTVDREIATGIITEMLAARDLLSGDQSLSASDAKNVCLLRPEYFDYVPETASFLRPIFPESLLGERPQLFWNGSERAIKLHLPGIEDKNLPAKWMVGNLIKNAAVNPHEFKLDSAAFKKFINLTIEMHSGKETQSLTGAGEWCLFDEDSDGRLVSRTRKQLPLRSYSLIATSPLNDLKLEGFDTENETLNGQISLSDKTVCYLTKLWPIARAAKVRFRHKEEIVEINFSRQSTIEAKCFAGWNKEAVCCEHRDGVLILDKLPLIAIAIPHGLFDDTSRVLNSEFMVFAGDHPTSGVWIEQKDGEFEDKRLFFWKWGSPPISEMSSGKVKSFKDLELLKKRIELKGRLTFKVESKLNGFCEGFSVDLTGKKAELHQKLDNFPGAFLPLVLIGQQPSGMTWDELLSAKDIICFKSPLKASLLRKYQREGILTKVGWRWKFLESRVVIRDEEEKIVVEYCGDPTFIWALLKRVSHSLKPSEIPCIEVTSKWGMAPYLTSIWPGSIKNELVKFFKSRSISIVSTLWNN